MKAHARRWLPYLLLAGLLIADGPDRIAAALGVTTVEQSLAGGAPAYQCIMLGIVAGAGFVAGGLPGFATLMGAMVAGDMAGCF